MTVLTQLKKNKKNAEEELDYMWISKYPVLLHMDPRMTETTESDVFVDCRDFLHTERVLNESQKSKVKGC